MGKIYRLVSCDDGYIYVFDLQEQFSFTKNENGLWIFTKKIDDVLREELKKYVVRKPMF